MLVTVCVELFLSALKKLMQLLVDRVEARERMDWASLDTGVVEKVKRDALLLTCAF